MSGRSRQEIEMHLMQHMRENSAAGAVNQVRSRTIDLLPVVVSVAEILGDVDLGEQRENLMLRLELGITQDVLGVARVLRGRLTRAEYLRFRRAGLGTIDALAQASVDEVADHLASDKPRAKILLELVRAPQEATAEAA
jgi:hypothetical protein